MDHLGREVMIDWLEKDGNQPRYQARRDRNWEFFIHDSVMERQAGRRDGLPRQPWVVNIEEFLRFGFSLDMSAEKRYNEEFVVRACPNNDQLDFWNRCLKNAEWATRSKELYGEHKTWNERELGSCLRCYTVGVIADNCPECNSDLFTLYQCPNSRVINPMWLSVLLYASSEDEAKNLCRRPVQNNFHTWRSMGVPLSLREYLGKFEERLELLELLFIFCSTLTTGR